jgi:uncharacterized protein (DUF2237 family)
MASADETQSVQKNVLGTALKACCFEPKTGFYRDGFCHTGEADRGSHVVCAVMTDEFLQFSKSKGNDLTTPMPQYGFPGLKAGDKWCLCAARWREALRAEKAPPVLLAATHESATQYVSLESLAEHAVDPEG